MKTKRKERNPFFIRSDSSLWLFIEYILFQCKKFYGCREAGMGFLLPVVVEKGGRAEKGQLSWTSKISGYRCVRNGAQMYKKHEDM